MELSLLPCVKVHMDNEDLLKFRAYLSFSCAMGRAGTPGPLALFDSSLGCSDKGRECGCTCGRRRGIKAGINL